MALDPFGPVTTTCVWQMSFVAFWLASKDEPSWSQVVLIPLYAGTVAVIFQSLSTVKFPAPTVTPPNVTSVAPVKPAPKMLTVLPPDSGPP